MRTDLLQEVFSSSGEVPYSVSMWVLQQLHRRSAAGTDIQDFFREYVPAKYHRCFLETLLKTDPLQLVLVSNLVPKTLLYEIVIKWRRTHKPDPLVVATVEGLIAPTTTTEFLEKFYTDLDGGQFATVAEAMAAWVNLGRPITVELTLLIRHRYLIIYSRRGEEAMDVVRHHICDSLLVAMNAMELPKHLRYNIRGMTIRTELFQLCHATSLAFLGAKDPNEKNRIATEYVQKVLAYTDSDEVMKHLKALGDMNRWFHATSVAIDGRVSGLDILKHADKALRKRKQTSISTVMFMFEA